jgi:hypothetical protein
VELNLGQVLLRDWLIEAGTGGPEAVGPLRQGFWQRWRTQW